MPRPKFHGKNFKHSKGNKFNKNGVGGNKHKNKAIDPVARKYKYIKQNREAEESMRRQVDLERKYKLKNQPTVSKIDQDDVESEEEPDAMQQLMSSLGAGNQGLKKKSDAAIESSSEDEDADDEEEEDEEDEDEEEVTEAEKTNGKENKSTKKTGKVNDGAKKSVTFEASAKKAEAKVDAKQAAADLASTRIFTDEDFKRIDAELVNKHVRNARKRPLEADKSEYVKLDDIEMIYKKRRTDKLARLETVMKGREDREKFGYRDKRKNLHCSKTNTEKRKTKNFGMMRHKARSKVKASFKDKQQALRKHLVKQKKMK